LFAVSTRIRDHHPPTTNGAGINMAEKKEPGVKGEPFAPNLTLEERLGALEMAWVEPESGLSGWDQRLAELTSRLETLAAEVAAQSSRVRDQEKSMVERIADVDDDRRLTSLQLQRGWQAQRDGFAAQVRRHGQLMMVLLVVSLIGFGLLAYYARTMPAAPVTLVGEVAALRQEVANVTQQNAKFQEYIAALSTPEATISQARDVPKSSAQDQGGDVRVLTKQLERLASELKNQGDELDALRNNIHKSSKGLQAGTVLSAGANTSKTAFPESALPLKPGEQLRNGPATAGTTPDTASSTPRKHTTKINDRPFALQLVGDSNRNRLLEYASSVGLPDTVYLYQGSRGGRPWFVLVHSLHQTSAEARTALAQIPAKQRVRAPWIRSLPKGTELEIVEQKSSHN
jgi:DamX protein